MLIYGNSDLLKGRSMTKLFVPIRTAFSRLLNCNKGISSVEFALVLNLFVLFTFGIIGFSAISYAHNNMVNAARESARRLSVADGITCSDGVCAGVAMICGTPEILPGTAEAVACDSLAQWGLTWTVTATEVVSDACDSTMQVGISTNASAAFMADFLGFFDPEDLLSVEVKMRKELTKRCVL